MAYFALNNYVYIVIISSKSVESFKIIFFINIYFNDLGFEILKFFVYIFF